jgi:hypothetical protein
MTELYACFSRSVTAGGSSSNALPKQARKYVPVKTKAQLEAAGALGAQGSRAQEILKLVRKLYRSKYYKNILNR